MLGACLVAAFHHHLKMTVPIYVLNETAMHFNEMN